jgi:glycosyltransferase involved in cell wall biosynthesis
MDKIRILQVITLAGFPGRSALGGGAQVVVKTLLEHLDRDRFHVTVAVGNTGYLTAAAEAYGAEVRVFPELRREISPMHDGLAVARLFGFIKREGFALVHTHSTKAGLVGRIASRLAAAPVTVHTVHGLPFHDFNGPWRNRAYKLAERFAGRLSDCLICVSDKDKRLAVMEGLVPDERAVTIPPGVDLTRYQPDVRDPAAREQLGIPSVGPVVGMIARLDAQKAPEDFVLAARQVLQRIPDATFLVVGDGPLRGRLAELARTVCDPARVILAGARTDIPAVLSAIDVFVLPSLWEGLPVTILEAMAMAKPVVATSIPGTVEIVQHDVTGLLVPPRDPARLAEAIVALLSDRDRARAMGREGSRLVHDRFDAERMVARTEALYLQLLARQSDRASTRAVA